MNTSKRLQKEAAALRDNRQEDIHLAPQDGNIMEWSAVIRGPPDSFYQGYEFDLKISVPSTYPMHPPTIKFVTKIFHPNVLYEVCMSYFVCRTLLPPKTTSSFLQTGEICLDILKKEWSPAWNLQSACRAIIALLAEPAPDRYLIIGS